MSATNPTQPTNTDQLARDCAEKIVKLTGFGNALHVNDIAPDIAAAFRPVVEERDEALKQQKYAWQRHAEKDSAYGEALAERDQLRAEVERLKVDNEALRTLWTEIRVVLIQSRAANCLCSYGAQQADAVEAANAVLNRMPPDITNERDQLRAEVAELRAWKAGKKGIEEYYQTCAERDQLRAALDVAREALREDLISARIIHAENEQRGHIHSIRRDAAFIEERCNQALARIDEVKGQQ